MQPNVGGFLAEASAADTKSNVIVREATASGRGPRFMCSRAAPVSDATGGPASVAPATDLTSTLATPGGIVMIRVDPGVH